MNVPRFRYHPTKGEEEALLAAFRAGHHARGPNLARFEAALAKRAGVAYGIGCGSGQAAIWLALQAIGVSGGAVAMPAIATCGAIHHAIRSAGGNPLAVDVDQQGRMTTATVRAAVSGSRLAAVVAPGYFGLPAGGAAIEESLGVPVVEDAAQGVLTALSTSAHPSFLTFSFYPTKGLAALDGGMVLTDDARLARSIQKQLDTNAFEPGQAHRPRIASRLPDINAAVGLAALDAAPARLRRLDQIAEAYEASLLKMAGVERLGCPSPAAVFTRFMLQFPAMIDRDAFLVEANRRNIAASKELSLVDVDGHKLQAVPNASRLVDTTASIPFYSDLRDEEVTAVCDLLGTA
jgi:dTDP-4-amino-4,6-dideoxygalactose transaminase